MSRDDARVFVRAMGDRKRVLVYTRMEFATAADFARFRDAVTASLCRASAHLPGTLVDPVGARRELLEEGQSSSLCVGGSVSSPTKLDFAQLIAVADLVAQILEADDIALAAPVRVDEEDA